MAYKYNPPPDNPPAETRKRILQEFARWRDQRNDPKTIGPYDFPMATKIGGANASCRFELDGRPVEIHVDTFDTYGRNLTAIYLAIQAMRLNEARGIAAAMQQAYAQLPAPAKHRDPWEVMGLRSDVSWEDVVDLYRLKAKRLHPDNGGSDAQMSELNAAFEAIRTERGK